jgi:hypothetical protein
LLFVIVWELHGLRAQVLLSLWWEHDCLGLDDPSIEPGLFSTNDQPRSAGKYARWSRVANMALALPAPAPLTASTSRRSPSYGLVHSTGAIKEHTAPLRLPHFATTDQVVQIDIVNAHDYGLALTWIHLVYVSHDSSVHTHISRDIVLVLRVLATAAAMVQAWDVEVTGEREILG